MRRSSAVLPLVLSLLQACSAGPAEPSADASTPPDGASRTEVPDDTVVLEARADGVEVGTSTLGADSVARFYSASRQAYWEYTIEAGDDMESVSADTEVHVALGTDGAASYFVWDPSGATAPVAFRAPLPESGAHTATIDPWEVSRADSTSVEFTEMPADPFGDFTIAGISVSISIQGIARSIVSSAVISVFTGLLGSACNAVAPLHDEICDVIVQVAEIAANLVVPGAKLIRGGAVTAFASAVGGEIWDWAADYACTEAGVLLGKSWNEEDEAQTLALRADFRRAVGEYHYLLWQLETNPPADPGDAAAARSALRTLGVQLTSVGPQLREGYVEIFSVSGPRPSQDPSAWNRVRSTTRTLISETTLSRVRWETVITDELAQAMFGPLPTGGIVLVDVPVGQIEISQQTLQELSALEIAGSIADCAIAVWTGIEGEVSDGAARRMARLSMPVFYEQAVSASLAATAEINRLYFGGGPIVLPCEFDEYEPNTSWESALASPVSLTVGSGPVWLRDLTLCTVMGTPIEEDWYAFPMGAIEFNVQARIRTPESAEFAARYASGADERVCIDLFYYGQTNELADAPPTALYGGCGTPTDVWTGSAGVRRALGESYSFILARVHADPSAMDPVGYDLGFAE